MDKDLYKNLIFEKFKRHFPEIPSYSLEDRVNHYFKFKEKENIYCEYCDIKLKPHQPPPYNDKLIQIFFWVCFDIMLGKKTKKKGQELADFI